MNQFTFICQCVNQSLIQCDDYCENCGCLVCSMAENTSNKVEDFADLLAWFA